MIVLGDTGWRNRAGQACELRFGAEGMVVAVVHAPVLEKWTVEQSDTGTAFIKVILRSAVPSSFAVLPDTGLVSLWARTGEVEPICMGTGLIDYWERSFDRAFEVVEMQARGALARLIDARCRASSSGTLNDLIRQVCGDTPGTVDGLDGRRVRAHVNSPSAYAALRLLGVAFDFVIQEDPRATVRILSTSKARDAERSQPVVVLTDDEIESGTIKRGTPVKKRGV
jgi:hypothetical protein